MLKQLLSNLRKDIGIPRNHSDESYDRLYEAADCAGFIDAALEDGYTLGEIRSAVRWTIS